MRRETSRLSVSLGELGITRRRVPSLSSPVSLLEERNCASLLPVSLGERCEEWCPLNVINVIKLVNIHRFVKNKRVPLFLV